MSYRAKSYPDYVYRILDDASRVYGVPRDGIRIVSNVLGQGRHMCGGDGSRCERSPVSGKCWKHLDDADRIVTVEYDKEGRRATYGVLHGEITCWAD